MILMVYNFLVNGNNRIQRLKLVWLLLLVVVVKSVWYLVNIAKVDN